MSAKSRRKGKRGELELAEWFRERGVFARRGAQHRGGPDSPDVEIDLPGFHVECKRCESLRLYDALDQARGDARAGAIPVVLHRKSRAGWVAILDAEAFVELAKDLERLSAEVARAAARADVEPMEATA